MLTAGTASKRFATSYRVELRVDSTALRTGVTISVFKYGLQTSLVIGIFCSKVFECVSAHTLYYSTIILVIKGID